MTLIAEQPPVASQPTAKSSTCAHCGLPVPAGLIRPEAEHQFCCPGCEAVFQTLHACGLDAYYRLRDIGDAAPQPAKPSQSSFASFDSPAFQNLYVTKNEDGSSCTDLMLQGVTCAACVWLVERLPRVIDGVIEARLSLREATVRVTWDPQRVPLSRIAQALDRLGYTPHPARGQWARELHRKESRRRLIHLGVAGAIMGNTMLLALALYAGTFGNMESQFRAFFRLISAGLGLLSLAWPGATFFRSAYAAIRMRVVNLDVPIALALAVGGIAGLVNVVLNRGEIYFDSLTVLVFLLLVGRFIQYCQQRRADDAVGLLFNLTPSSCRIVRGEQMIEAPIESLVVGDVVEVRAGELFPVDGVVETGRSSMNQALLTGESAPTSVGPGSAVHAGAQNVGSVLRVRVERVGRDTRVGRLMHLIERGVQEKPTIVQFADRVAGWFVIVLTIVAAGVFAFWSRHSLSLGIDHTVALLIVTCPCVLGLATPLTIAITIGRLARRDILVKSGAALERLSRGGSLLLDKTGTLTEGRLQLTKWVGETKWQALVGEVERNSNHPVGRALAESLGSKELDALSRSQITEIVERGDGGISARLGSESIRIGSPSVVRRAGAVFPQAIDAAVSEMEQSGATTVVVGLDGVAVAAASLGDKVRDDSPQSIAALRRLELHPAILSGDAQQVVNSVAQQVGIEISNASGQLAPEQKLDRVRGSASDRVTVMVGDGVNDAAALAAAAVGIAVHGGAEASLSAADVYIARPGLAPLVDLVKTSRDTMRVIRRNLVVSLSYNLLAGALAAMGLMTPMLAAIIMPVSSATVLSLTIASVSGRRGKPKGAA